MIIKSLVLQTFNRHSSNRKLSVLAHRPATAFIGVENISRHQSRAFLPVFSKLRRLAITSGSIGEKSFISIDPIRLSSSTTNSRFSSKMEWRKITCFGDSITRRSKDPDYGCWAGHIAQKTLNYYDVDVRGFEGYNTRWGLELMPKLFPRSYLDKVDIFISFFGHNDSWEKSAPMHIPVEEFEKNTRAIIDYLKENGLDTSKIILITPAWYYEPDLLEFLKLINFPPAGKNKQDAVKYSEAVKRVAKDYNITCVDFYGKTVDFEPLKSLFCDGVHFSREGAKLLFDNLWPEVEKKIVEQHGGKNLIDIYHVTPVDKRPDVLPAIEAYLKSNK